MKTTPHKTGFSKLRMTYVLLALALLAALGSYGWRLYVLYQAWRHDTPQPQVERLIRDLRRFQAETGQFPTSFHEINQRFWHTQPPPDYGADGRQAHVRNYHYRYTRVEPQKCALWALPIGPQREYGAAFFIVITPAWARGWKGKALREAQTARLPLIPTPEELAALQMNEIPLRYSLRKL